MTMDVQFNEVFEHVMMNAIIAACEGNGVLDGLTVSERGAGANMSVDVAAGSAWIDDTKYTESSTVNLTISAADATYDRKDLVTYDSNTSNPIVTTGTAAPTPEPPESSESGCRPTARKFSKLRTKCRLQRATGEYEPEVV